MEKAYLSRMPSIFIQIMDKQVRLFFLCLTPFMEVKVFPPFSSRASREVREREIISDLW